MGVLNTDSAKLRAAASELDRIKNDTLQGLGRYLTMNQDLTGAAFGGNAALASLRTTEDVSTTGRNVTARFDSVISAMQQGAAEYDRVEAENQANIASVASGT
jgi:hypothetical protein